MNAVHGKSADCGGIEARWRRVTADIARLAARYHRPAGSVKLIAVGKQQAAEKVAALARLGQLDFAENYAQEGVEKIARVGRQLADDAAGGATETAAESAIAAAAAESTTAAAANLRWHFIGHIQSRKCRAVAAHFDWVHSIDSVKVARRLSEARAGAAPLNVLIQLNLQGEESKHGVSEAALPKLAEATAEMPNLRLRGLMIVPKPEASPAKQRGIFARCQRLGEQLTARGFTIEHLSMGMSGDMEAAIAEGATMVRIGSAVFGPRPPPE